MFATSETKPVIEAKPAFVVLATSAKIFADGPAFESQPSQPEWPMSM